MKSFRNLVAALFLSIVTLSNGSLQKNISQEKSLYTIPTIFRIDAQSIRIPNQKNLGLMGLHALINFHSSFYAGAGLYAAALGENSGFFALGVEGGIQRALIGKIWGDAGLFVGAGGGHGMSGTIGEGQFWEPHIGLQYHFSYFNLGINWSHIQFSSGKITSNQILVNLDVPTEWSITTADHAGESISQFFAPKDVPEIAFQSNYLSAGLSLYFPKQGTKNVSGAVMDNTVTLAGAEFGHYLNDKNFIYIGMQGAVAGNKNGFAVLVGGLGHSWFSWFNQRLQLLTRVGLGSAGGGAVDTGGGLIFLGEAGVGYFFSPRWETELDGGFLWAPTSSYRAAVSELRLKYHFGVGHESRDGSHFLSENSAYIHAWRIRFGNQTYLHPERENDVQSNIQLFSVKLDDFVNDSFYVTGQTAFAYSGDAAGYFSGLIGPGFQTQPVWQDRLRGYGELLIGAAGGAGLEMGEGFITEPLVGLQFQFNPWWGAYTSIGKTFAMNDRFNAWTIDAGLSFSFGMVEM